MALYFSFRATARRVDSHSEVLVSRYLCDGEVHFYWLLEGSWFLHLSLFSLFRDRNAKWLDSHLRGFGFSIVRRCPSSGHVRMAASVRRFGFAVLADAKPGVSARPALSGVV